MPGQLLFPLENPSYLIHQLHRADADQLQSLYERCEDFFRLTSGLPPSATAGGEEFDDVPAGKGPDDLYIFGLYPTDAALVGVMTAVQHYPDPQTWWIGVMLLDPQYRGRGLGRRFYQGFERWVVAQGASRLQLMVISANEAGFAFWQRRGFQRVRQVPNRTFGHKTHDVYVLQRAIHHSVH